MTCKQLGGACNLVFEAETFEEITEMSKSHVMEMFRADDDTHLEAMKKMRKLGQSPEAMQDWLKNKKREFDNLLEE